MIVCIIYQLYNFYLSLLSGNDLSRVSKHKKYCKYALRYINDHIRYLSGEKVEKTNAYIWHLFLNFTDNNTEIWYEHLNT